jgi:vacuolar-type H+-ATPase subunit E/Vma4
MESIRSEADAEYRRNRRIRLTEAIREVFWAETEIEKVIAGEAVEDALEEFVRVVCNAE